MTGTSGTDATSCPACGAFVSTRRWSKHRGFCQCPRCGVLYRHPQPDDQTLAVAYASCYYPRDAEARSTYGNTPYALNEQLLSCLRREHLLPPRGGRLLDFGCGVGEFADLATRQGLDVDAVEPDDVARGAAAALGIRVHATLEALRADGRTGYDVITLVDVLEHVRHPLALLQALRTIVRPSGALYIGVPDFRSAQARVLGGRWDQASNPTHLFLFSPSSLRRLLSLAGFSMVRLSCLLHDPRLGRVERMISGALQRGRLSAALRVVARPE